jgi:Ser/Thr protein kinase RdoA (MazF antagonist)
VTTAHGNEGQDALLQRLESVAHKASGLVDSNVVLTPRLINHSENTTYLLSDDAGTERKILRIHRIDYHSPAAIKSELTWVDALRNEAGVHTPQILPGCSDDRIQFITTDDVPEGRQCVFFEYLAGEEPDEDNLLPSFPNLGETTARMHRHARNWTLPDGFERFHWNVDTAFGGAPHWGHWYYGPNLNNERNQLFTRLVSCMSDRLNKFGTAPDRYGLVHADMRVANLLIHNGDTRVIDFDDSGISWYLYDLATALSFIEERPDVPDLIGAWLEGYRREEEMSQAEEDEIPTFLMLRRMLILAWMGSHSETDLAQSLGDEYTDVSCDLAEIYMAKFG